MGTRRLSAGSCVQAPESKEDGDRRGGVRDPGGTTWWISQQISG